MDAVGLYSNRNQDPLMSKGRQDAPLLYDIVEKTSTTMRLVSKEAQSGHPANYLGGIASADGSVVYWTNETRPLP